ncbi:MAG: lipid-A-disaccharide synthase [Candidatus Firestonebacteria bacterium]
MKIFINVGDSSADVYAANLVKELKILKPKIEIFGNGGSLMQEAGVKLYYNLVDFGIIGFTEAAKSYFKLMRVLNKTVDFIIKNKIEAVILIDYPGFNLILAEKLKKHNIKVIYYVLPQVWAWGRGRIKKIKKFIDKAFVIFSFEKKIYEEANIPVEFFGHPLVDIVKPSKTKQKLRHEFKLDKNKKIIGLFPGSRYQEIHSLLPLILKTVRNLKDVQFVLCQAVSIGDSTIKKYLISSNLNIKVIKGRQYDIMSVCDCILASSGTVTLEAAIIGVPLVVIYKVSPFSFFLAKNLLKIPYIALPNILAGSKIVPELFQDCANEHKILKELSDLLYNKKIREKMINDLKRINIGLGKIGVSQRMAKGMLKCLK